MRLEAAKTQGSRHLLLWVGLLLTLGLVYWQWSAEQGENEAIADSSLSMPQRTRVAAQDKLPQTATTPGEIQVAQSTSEQTQTVTNVSASWSQRNLPAAKLSHPLFVAHEWLPPPPKPQPPPPPQAPPLPYTYVGSMQDVPDGSTVILMQQKKVLMPKLGSQVTPQWRLDREDTQSVYFTYLPLNQAIVLSKAKTATASQRQLGAETEDNIPIEQ
jgi:hypothetical protein